MAATLTNDKAFAPGEVLLSGTIYCVILYAYVGPKNLSHMDLCNESYRIMAKDMKLYVSVRFLTHRGRMKYVNNTTNRSHNGLSPIRH